MDVHGLPPTGGHRRDPSNVVLHTAEAHDPGPTIVCRSGYSYDSGSGLCERVNQIPPFRDCPSGYSYSAASGLCERPEATAIPILS